MTNASHIAPIALVLLVLAIILSMARLGGSIAERFAQQWVALNENVSHGMLIVPESRQCQLARHHTASEPGVALQNHDLLSSGRQVRGSNQPVVAGPHGNDVE